MPALTSLTTAGRALQGRLVKAPDKLLYKKHFDECGMVTTEVDLGTRRPRGDTASMGRTVRW
jgi:hypothetical protein